MNTWATYSSGLRLAEIVHGLHSRRHGWSYDGMAEFLGVSRRTVQRYARALTKELWYVERFERGGRPYLRIRDGV